MGDVSAYRQQTRSSEQQIANRSALVDAFESSSLPTDQKLINLGLFMRSGAFAKLLFLNEIYEQIIRVPGDIAEFGCWWGQSLVTFLNLRAVHEPYCNRKVIGFDTFSGYPAPSGVDKHSDTIKVGGYTVSDDYLPSLTRLLEYHERENVLAHINKFALVKGDVTETAAKYYEDHPEALVALAFFDLALYEPTKAALLAIKDRLVKGSILAFDELADADYPGETKAAQEVIGLRNTELIRSRFLPARCYMIIR